MTDPAVPTCLSTAYSSKFDLRGGTLIAEDVVDHAEHLRRLADPDAYRPAECSGCGERPHAHDFRDRRLRGEVSEPWVTIRRYRCRPCKAVWQVLPAFVARHLHYPWRLIQATAEKVGVLSSEGEVGDCQVPVRTARRWVSRLLLSAVQLLQLLASSGQELSTSVTDAPTRAALADVLADSGAVEGPLKLAALAGWTHRLVPGVRLM